MIKNSPIVVGVIASDLAALQGQKEAQFQGQKEAQLDRRRLQSPPNVAGEMIGLSPNQTILRNCRYPSIPGAMQLIFNHGSGKGE